MCAALWLAEPQSAPTALCVELVLGGTKSPLLLIVFVPNLGELFMGNKHPFVLASVLIAATASLSACAPAPIQATPVAAPAAAELGGSAASNPVSETSGHPYLPPFGPVPAGLTEETLFNPCTEIPEEALIEIGFGPKSGSTSNNRGVEVVCTYEVPETGDDLGFATFVTSPLGFEDLKTKTRSVVEETDIGGIEVLVALDSIWPTSACTAHVETEKGTFSLTVNDFLATNVEQQICPLTLDLMARIISL
ncbi:MAG: DUF3558 family protein [Corynebacterium sp.]|nr:DUF3558 family protein [Corynebacterium sp.]